MQVDPAAARAYQPYWAVRAHLLQRVERPREAIEAFDRAIALTEDAAIRQFLVRRAHDGSTGGKERSTKDQEIRSK